MKCITTSWDDGHPLDFKIAELLDKYNMQGTFYIPKHNNEHAVMTEAEIVSLSNKYEIGGHTLNHVRLYQSAEKIFEHEVGGSFKWLSELLNYEPVSFCFPGGVYDTNAIRYVKKAGYKVYRTTELLSIQQVIKNGSMPTSIQLYEHSRFTYLKHLAKRRRINNSINWMLSGPTADLLNLADYYIKIIELKGEGCFHLWGHSWEIEEFGLWSKLERLLQHLSTNIGFQYLQNKQLTRSAS